MIVVTCVFIFLCFEMVGCIIYVNVVLVYLILYENMTEYFSVCFFFDVH